MQAPGRSPKPARKQEDGATKAGEVLQPTWSDIVAGKQQSHGTASMADDTCSDGSEVSPEQVEKLHKLWQHTKSLVGEEDPMAKAAFTRWESARSKAASAKPWSTQIMGVEKRIKAVQKKVDKAQQQEASARAQLQAALDAHVDSQKAIGLAQDELAAAKAQRAELASRVAVGPDAADMRDVWAKLGLWLSPDQTPELQLAMRAFTEAFNAVQAIHRQQEGQAEADPYDKKPAEKKDGASAMDTGDGADADEDDDFESPEGAQLGEALQQRLGQMPPLDARVVVGAKAEVLHAEAKRALGAEAVGIGAEGAALGDALANGAPAPVCAGESSEAKRAKVSSP